MSESALKRSGYNVLNAEFFNGYQLGELLGTARWRSVSDRRCERVSCFFVLCRSGFKEFQTKANYVSGLRLSH